LPGDALSAFLFSRKRFTLDRVRRPRRGPIDFSMGDTVSEIRLTALVPAGG
jgi:hypothetical protein